MNRDTPKPKAAAKRKSYFAWIPLLYLIVSGLIGGTTGLGAYTFGYAKGSSYLTSDSAACANCHVMQNQYDAWIKSSHGKFASCNDCHAPHDAAGKLYCKARNGFFHSLAFTTGEFEEPIRIHQYNEQVVEASCRDCHSQLSHEIDSLQTHAGQDAMSCIRCHPDVGHATHK